jgi:hypothetical protein
MFDDMMREIERLDGMEISVPIGLDDDGYIDRDCPGEECHFKFKVHGEDWGRIMTNGRGNCPMCGLSSDPNNFYTTEHAEEAKAKAFEQIKGLFVHALDRGAQSFNRKWPRDSFLQMSMQVTGPKWIPPIVALTAREEIQLKITCEECGCRFAVIGSAYFCPACGHSEAVRVFDGSMTKIEAKVQYLETFRQAVAQGNKDHAELVCRSMLETGLSDGVVALQRVFDQLYSRQPGAILLLSPNVFQRLDGGSALWKNLTGKGYDDFLTAPELDRLKVLFQRRHLLSHSEGIVDQKYIDKSGDTTYNVGQRIVVNKQDVLDMVRIIRKLVTGYLGELGNGS